MCIHLSLGDNDYTLRLDCAVRRRTGLSYKAQAHTLGTFARVFEGEGRSFTRLDRLEVEPVVFAAIC